MLGRDNTCTFTHPVSVMYLHLSHYTPQPSRGIMATHEYYITPFHQSILLSRQCQTIVSSGVEEASEEANTYLQAVAYSQYTMIKMKKNNSSNFKFWLEDSCFKPLRNNSPNSIDWSVNVSVRRGLTKIIDKLLIILLLLPYYKRKNNTQFHSVP